MIHFTSFAGTTVEKDPFDPFDFMNVTAKDSYTTTSGTDLGKIRTERTQSYMPNYAIRQFIQMTNLFIRLTIYSDKYVR